MSLLDFFSRAPASPPLTPVVRRFTGQTIEEALRRFEDACSDENFQTLTIQNQAERRDGVLVCYEVNWKYSVLHDDTCGHHVSWALLAPADPVAGDPPDAHYRVAAATRDHHMPDAVK